MNEQFGELGGGGAARGQVTEAATVGVANVAGDAGIVHDDAAADDVQRIEVAGTGGVEEPEGLNGGSGELQAVGEGGAGGAGVDGIGAEGSAEGGVDQGHGTRADAVGSGTIGERGVGAAHGGDTIVAAGIDGEVGIVDQGPTADKRRVGRGGVAAEAGRTAVEVVDEYTAELPHRADAGTPVVLEVDRRTRAQRVSEVADEEFTAVAGRSAADDVDDRQLLAEGDGADKFADTRGDIGGGVRQRTTVQGHGEVVTQTIDVVGGGVGTQRVEIVDAQD